MWQRPSCSKQWHFCYSSPPGKRFIYFINGIVDRTVNRSEQKFAKSRQEVIDVLTHAIPLALSAWLPVWYGRQP